jgi:hypothetical protein
MSKHYALRFLRFRHLKKKHKWANKRKPFFGGSHNKLLNTWHYPYFWKFTQQTHEIRQIVVANDTAGITSHQCRVDHHIGN